MSTIPSNSNLAEQAVAAVRDSFVDTDTILRIKNLELRAKVVVEGFMSGLHRSPYHGFSVEFSEHRKYTDGDDPNDIDWLVRSVASVQIESWRVPFRAFICIYTYMAKKT